MYMQHISRFSRPFYRNLSTISVRVNFNQIKNCINHLLARTLLGLHAPTGPTLGPRCPRRVFLFPKLLLSLFLSYPFVLSTFDWNPTPEQRNLANVLKQIDCMEYMYIHHVHRDCSTGGRAVSTCRCNTCYSSKGTRTSASLQQEQVIIHTGCRKLHEHGVPEVLST